MPSLFQDHCKQFTEQFEKARKEDTVVDLREAFYGPRVH